MKALSLLLGLLLLVGASPSHAVPHAFTAFLDGPSESPSNSSPGLGLALAVLDDTAHTLFLGGAFAGLVEPTTVAHIHCCVAPPGTVSPATFAPLPGFPLGVTDGAFGHTFDTTQDSSFSAGFLADNGGTAAGAGAALLAGLLAGAAYFNIHTSAFQAGEIRGFFAPASVAEPGSLALFGTGLIVVGVKVFTRYRMRR
jgi:CHRD domain